MTFAIQRNLNFGLCPSKFSDHVNQNCLRDSLDVDNGALKLTITLSSPANLKNRK